MKIGIWHKTPDRIVGCKKVVDNLKKGLDQLGQEYIENQLGDINGCIHGSVPEFKNRTLPKKTVIGPEIMILPEEMPDAWSAYKNWIQPSQWVVDYMKQSYLTRRTNFYVWSAGIDVKQFYCNRLDTDQDCFIYYKNVTRQTPVEKLQKVKNHLDKKRITYKVIEYGIYDENRLIELASKSKYAIWLVGTESQNIALMEVLAMDCPIYVINEPEFSYHAYKFQGASSAPYFDYRCGIIAKDINKLTEFIDNLNNYAPHSYIQEYHTCKKSAERYIEILKECHDENT